MSGERRLAVKWILAPNPTYPEAVRFAHEVADFLLRSGQEICSDQADAERLRGADFVIAIGGDGTMLRAVRRFAALGIPFWGINMGHMGYLVEAEPWEAFPALERLLRGEYRLEERVTLAGTGGGADFFALNELTIHRSGYGHTLQLEVRIDGTEVYRYGGDGLLLSTPTGSTAYNLSAGGPVLMPESRLMAVTPICAHTALCAPIVVPEGSEVRVRVLLPEPDGDELPTLIVDGCDRYPLQAGDEIACRIGELTVPFARTADTGFFTRLQKKMAKGR